MAHRPALHLALILASLLSAASCEPSRVDIDPAVVERPLPAPGDPVDPELAAAGRVLFGRTCAACHRMEGGPVVGPPLAGVVRRRGAAWVKGMVLSPDSMLREDPVARNLLAVYRVPMPDTRLGEAQFRAVLEFLRSGQDHPRDR